MQQTAFVITPSLRLQNGVARDYPHPVTREEPLEIRINGRPVGILMRTPGHERELTMGYAFTEGYVFDPSGIRDVVMDMPNRADLQTAPGTPLGKLPEHALLARSSCSLCGRDVVDALQGNVERLPDGPLISVTVLRQMLDAMEQHQPIRAQTGSTHAAGLFDTAGQLLVCHEDVGRHNALDKAVGWALLNRRPLAGCVAVVTSRASYEMVAKAVRARIPIFCSVSAPTSLALELARDFHLTYVGFLRPGGFSVYTHPGRIHDLSTIPQSRNPACHPPSRVNSTIGPAVDRKGTPP